MQKELNFENYLGETLWLEFVAYKREETYQNDNYISDGLDNALLFKRALEFINEADKEIIKSATLQHSITGTLKNLLVMKEFKPIVEYFEVGNWIRIKVDNNIYKLRLLDYEINFEDITNIAITFSDVKKVASGVTDLESILNQASSMSTSYNSVKRQAEQGEKSNAILNQWVERGLNITNTNIVGGADNQTQIWDEHGMLFRKYDPINDIYEDSQFKIINSTIALTTDNWKTVKTAIGEFYYYHPQNGLTKGYGVNAETIIGNLILGQELGIYNSNGSLSFDKNGFIVTNDINTFTINPNGSILLSLTKANENLLYIDESGSLHLQCEEIDAKVSKDGIISAINLSTEEASIKAEKISLEGLVTANSNFKILTDGSVEINSGSITSNHTSTQYTQTSVLNAGALTFKVNDQRHGRIDAGIIYDDDGNEVNKTLGLVTDTNAIIVFGHFAENKVMVDTTFCEGNITSKSIRLSTSDYALILDSWENSNGYVNSGIRWNDGDSNHMLLGVGEKSNYGITPWFGNSNYYTNIYSSNGEVYVNGSSEKMFATTTSSSDKRLKNEICDLSKYENFYQELKPIAYKFHSGLYGQNKTPKTQWGFYAQDVLTAYSHSNIDWKDETFISVKDTELSDQEKMYIDDGVLYQLNYQNVIALNTHMIQKILKENQTIQEKISNIEKTINGT